MQQLTSTQRLSLMKFVCSFAWADLRVTEPERAVIRRMILRLHLDENERAQVRRWLEVPPRPEEVDPARVPLRHRELFLAAARAVIDADGQAVQSERESYALLEEVLR
jgi:uncharacterized tellurite resistance protein B-like protein